MSVPPTLTAPADDDKNILHEAAEPQPRLLAKSTAKSDQDNLSVTFTGGVRAPSPDPSIISIDDANNIGLGRNPEYLLVPDESRRHVSRSPAAHPRTLKAKVQVFWTRNKGLALVLISQVFGTLMNVTTRLLEVEGNNGTQDNIYISIAKQPTDFYRQRVSSIPSTSSYTVVLTVDLLI
jgi:hypothetical protein